GTMRAGGRLGELRFDTDLDVSHAVVRYLELLKLAALIAQPEGVSLAEGLRDVNARILQAVTAEQREIFSSSTLDDYLLDAERDGFGDTEGERQLRGKAAVGLTRYPARFQSAASEPVWFGRAFSFRLGPHLLRGRVDRVDRLPGGEYELIDYKTGRPKSAGQL